MSQKNNKPNLKDINLQLNTQKDLLNEVLGLAEEDNFIEILKEKLAAMEKEIKRLADLKVEVAKARNTRKKEKRQK